MRHRHASRAAPAPAAEAILPFRPANSLLHPAGAWRALSPEAQERIGIAALVYAVGAIGCAGGLEPQQGWAAAQMEGDLALQDAVDQAVVTPLGAATLPRPDLSAIGVRACRSCGCTDSCACPDGCSWTGPDLCSACDLRTALRRPIQEQT